MVSKIWVKTNYQDGEFVDISKAIAIRVVKIGVWYHVNAEFILCDKTMERTLWSYKTLEEAQGYIAKLLTKTTGLMEDL